MEERAIKIKQILIKKVCVELSSLDTLAPNIYLLSAAEMHLFRYEINSKKNTARLTLKPHRKTVKDTFRSACIYTTNKPTLWYR